MVLRTHAIGNSNSTASGGGGGGGAATRQPGGGSNSRRRAMAGSVAAAAALLAGAVFLLSTASAQQLNAAPVSVTVNSVAATAVQQLAGTKQLSLVPTRMELEDHELLYQRPPGTPRGMVVLLHKCGRAAGDHWPASASCRDCLGLPESVSKLKQALARGYVVAAMSSADRSTGGGGRCWKWSDDARAVATAVRQLPRTLNLPAGAPVYVGGASSGGSLALRLPQLVRFNGTFGEVIAPTGMEQLLGRMRDSFPPAAYIHMPLDEGMAAKVAENLGAIRGAGLRAGEIKVLPRPLHSFYFSDRSTQISRPVSALLFSKLQQLKLLNETRFIAVDPKNVVWNAFKSYMANELRAELARLQPARQDLPTVAAHVSECISLAWARHETVGEYLTAVLIWLEGKGRGDLAALGKQYRVARPSSLFVSAAAINWVRRP